MMSNIYKIQILDGLRKNKLQILFILLFVLLARVSVIGLPFILKFIVDEIPKYQLEAFSGELTYLPFLAIGYACLFLTTTLLDEAKEYFSEKLIQPIVATIGARAFNKLINLPEDYILSNKSGAVMRDIDRGLKAMQSLSTLFIHTIIPTFLELLFVTIFSFFTYDYSITLIILLGVLLHGSVTLAGSQSLSKEKVRLNEVDSVCAAKLGEAVTNSETIKLFATEAQETQGFLDSLNSYSTQAVRFQFMHSKLRVLQQAIIATILCALLLRASYFAMHNLMSAGEFVLLNVLAMQVLLPISFLGSMWKEALRLKADISKLADLFETHSSNQDILSTTISLDTAPPSIRFTNVSFGYDSATSILVDASFSIPSGKLIALVGLSGSGKTTIIKLLLGFLSPTSGSIEINQLTSNQLDRQQFRKSVGVVPQNVTLFHGTVASNIAYGKRSASKKEIINVARLAQIDNFIESLSSGYETEVGERGLKLSGGERQMLGIARALINNPKMLILDEASSSLDSISEARIIQSAIKAKGARTCLIIAHKLTTVMQADEIIVLDQGTIVEQGTHETLLKKDGRYRSLWRAQNP